MAIYIGLEVFLLMSSFLIYFGRFSKESKDRIFCLLMTFVLTIVAGLRGQINPDYNNYKWAFYAIQEREFSKLFVDGFTNFEPGFKVFTKFMAIITDGNYVLYLITIAFATYALWFYAIKKYTNNVWLATLLYVNAGLYLFSFNLCRQLLVVSLSILQLQNIKEKRFKNFVLLAMLCAVLHKSSLVLIILYFIVNPPIITRTTRNIILGGVVIFLLLFRERIVSFVISLVYKSYETEGAYGIAGFSVNNIIMPLFISTLVFVLWRIMRLRVLLQEDDEYVIDNICIFGTIFYIVFCLLGLYMTNLNRVSYYFFPYASIAASNLISKLLKSNRRVVSFCIIVITVTYFLITTSNSAMNPYVFFWGAY